MKRNYYPKLNEITHYVEKTLIIPKKNFYKNIKGVGKEVELVKDKCYNGLVFKLKGSSQNITNRSQMIICIENEQGILTEYYELNKFIIGTSKVREIRLSNLLDE